MTIIHLLIGFGGGGAEHFVLELAKQNQIKGFKVLVVSISSVDKIRYKFIDSQIDTISLGVNTPSEIFSGFKKLLALINTNKNVLIHAHMFHAAMFGSLVKVLKPSVPLVFTLNNNFVKKLYRRVLFFLTRPLRDIDIILSDNMGKWYHKSDPVVIPNGIDISRFNLPRNPSPMFTCLFIGRIEEQKNPFYLVDLVLLLKEQYIFKIDIVGDGILKDELLKKISEHKIESYFNFLGYRKDIPELLSQAHCFIMPSLWEGLPVAMLEAGAAGIPVIATPVGSIDSVLNNTNGYLVDIKDFHLSLKEVMDNYPEALKKALILKDNVEKNYNIDITAEKQHRIYETLLLKR